MRYFYLFILVLFFNSEVNAQQLSLSEEAEISIITIGPGPYLYDKFGHSAFRISDPTNQLDAVYNYGSYDFNTPNFYTKFARGKLLYQLVVNPYEPFLNHYKNQNRWVKEQLLNLNRSEKLALFSFLRNNAKPENRDYLYDFLYDNCATKIRDVLKEVVGENLAYNSDFVSEAYSFRELIQKNVQANSWGSLGMDVAIGAVTDRQASAWEYQFLPNYVYEAAATATIDRKGQILPLVTQTNVLYEHSPEVEVKNFFRSPLFVFGILGLMILFMTYRDFKANKRSRYLDALLFCITGLIGLFLALLWWGTDHSTTVNNYNLLWAFPFSLLVSFGVARSKPKAWVRRYVVFLLLMFVLLIIHWISGVQSFAIGFIPLFLALVVRYFYVQWYLKRL